MITKIMISGSNAITRFTKPETSKLTVVEVSSAATGVTPVTAPTTRKHKTASGAILGQLALKKLKALAKKLWILENLAKLVSDPRTALIIMITKIAGSNAITRLISGAGSIVQLIVDVVVVAVSFAP